MLNKYCLYQMLTIQLSSTQLTDKIKLSLLFTALRENTALTVGFLKGKKGWVTKDLKFGLRQGRASPVAQLGIHLQCGRPGFYPWVGKIPWRRERLSTPAVWPGEFPGLYSPWDCKESDTTDQLSLSVQFSSVQSLSCVWLFVTPWTVARQASLSITNS